MGEAPQQGDTPAPTPEPAAPPRRGVAWWVRRLIVLVLGGGLIVVLAASLVVWWYGRGAQDVDVAELESWRPLQVTTVLAADGTVLGEIHGGERRVVVPLARVPEHVRRAFLAAEDARFFEHAGLDVVAVLRAAWVNLSRGEVRQGASTITQQVVKNLLLSAERSVERKSMEIVLAGRVEQELGKERILELYLNAIYLGEGRWGVEAASRHYFGVGVEALTVGQAAVLAALPKAPGRVTPLKDPERVRARRDWVLDRMVAEGLATEEDVAPHRGVPLPLQVAAAPDRTLAPEVLARVRAQLAEQFGSEALPYLGATVQTTIQPAAQALARASLQARLRELEQRHRRTYGRRPTAASDGLRQRVLSTSPPTDPEAVVPALVVRRPSSWVASSGEVAVQIGRELFAVDVREALGEQEAADAVYRDGTTVDVRVAAAADGDGPRRARLAPGPEGAVIVADVERAEIVALVGGRGSPGDAFDRATRARRQPASTFKPFVFAAALRSGVVDAATRVPGEGDPPAQVSVREALAHSSNAAALDVYARVGHAELAQLATAVGFAAAPPDLPSTALGTAEATPLEVLTAYLTLARRGNARQPRLVRRVHWPDGREWIPPDVAPAGIGEALADLVRSLLESVVEGGTARAAARLARPLAGKTGTSDEARDAWFAAFTPTWAGVAWVGFDRRPSLGQRESGATAALPVLVDVLAGLEEREGAAFVRSGELLAAVLDRRSGTPACALRTTWPVPESCTGFWLFERCEPAHDAPHPAYLWCADPRQWLEELFLPVRPAPVVQPATLADPTSPRGVTVARVAVFAPSAVQAHRDPEKGVDAQWLAGIERSLLPLWESYGSRARPGEARVRLRLELDVDGGVFQVAGSGSAPPWLVAELEATVARGRFAPVPPGHRDFASQRGLVEVDLVW